MQPTEKAIPRVGLIGISGYGQVYLRHLEAAMACGSIDFVGAVVVNRSEEAAACERLEACGVTLYDSWQGMLQACRGQLDLCLIPVPIHLHEELTVAALESGANVLVEKPLAATVAQVRSIQEAERRTGRWVAVGYQDFYRPSVLAIRKELAAGRIGKVKSVRWVGLWPRGKSYFDRNAWAGRLAIEDRPVRDSPLNNAMAHFLNLSLYWAGAEVASTAWPQSVEAELFRCFPIESFDTAVIRVQTETGITVQASVTHCCPVEHPVHIQVLGEKGTLDWIHMGQVIWTDEKGAIDAKDMETQEEAVAAMFESVFARLSSSEARICTTSLALPQVACIEAIHKGGTIRDISPSCLAHERPNSDPCDRSIRNIENDLWNCFRQGSLPSELGVNWGKSPRMEPRRRQRSSPLESARRGLQALNPEAEVA